MGQERRDEFLRRMYAGEDPISLAEKVGVTKTFLQKLVRDHLRAAEERSEPVSAPDWYRRGRKGFTTKAQREEIARRSIAGERTAALAEEFSVTRAFVNLLKNQTLYPKKFAKKASFIKKLTPAEIEKFKRALASSIPTDHNLIPHSDDWSIDHGYQLAKKLFKKSPSKRIVVECVSPYLRERRANYFPRPMPPKKPHPSQIPPELAKDPDFVAYYMSPLAQRIAQKEYELAIADYEARFATDEEKADIAAERAAMAPKPAALPAQPPRKPLGKHAQTKGSRSTPPKRKKRR